MSLHKVGLESSSTGLLSPLILQARSLAVVSLDSDRDSGNLVNPFMRVTN